MSIVIGMLALGGAFLLIAAAAGHLRRPVVLRSALRAQRLLPPRWHRPVVVGVPAVEASVGVAVVLAVCSGRAAVPALVAQAAVYAVFAGYLAVLLRYRRGAPCGCFAGESAGRATVVRAVTLAAGAAVLASFGQDPVPAQWRPTCLAGGFLVAATAFVIPILG